MQVGFAQEIVQACRYVGRAQSFRVFSAGTGKADAARLRQGRVQCHALRVAGQRQCLLARAVIQLGQALQGLPTLRAQGVGPFQLGDGVGQTLFSQQQFRMADSEIVLVRRQSRRRGVAGQRRLAVRTAQHITEVVVEQGVVGLLLERQFQQAQADGALAQFQHRQSLEMLRFGQGRIQFIGGLVGIDRFDQLALLLQLLALRQMLFRLCWFAHVAIPMQCGEQCNRARSSAPD